MEMPREKHCSHIARLRPRPDSDELTTLRKRLRSVKTPTYVSDFHGSHSQIGEFAFYMKGRIQRVKWKTPDGVAHDSTIAALNRTKKLEAARLELGWIVANMYQLDGMHRCEPIPDLRVMMSEMKWFDKHESAWRKWATASVEQLAPKQA